MHKLKLARLAGFILLCTSSQSVTAQVHTYKFKHDLNQRKIICYYTEETIARYLPPPEAYLQRKKSGEEPGATFLFDIINPPNSAVDTIAAVAAEIWGSLIYSPVPIRIQLEFTDLPSGTLGSTAPVYPGYIIDNGYIARAVPVQALVEKFLGRNLNGDNPDMLMEFTNNPNGGWYFKTDGATPGSQLDLLSVVLHEMGHGLGYHGFFTVDDETDLGEGLYPPTPFDFNFINADGTRISDTTQFPNNSDTLAKVLVTPPVKYFSNVIHEELPDIVDEMEYPIMFIPESWLSGNSLYHLDEVTFNLRQEGRDALMTPYAAKGEAIHSPGPVTTYQLWETGWVHTFIEHDTLRDVESSMPPATALAKIHGDLGIDTSSTWVFYSYDGFTTPDSLRMTETGNVDEYSAEIPLPGTDTVVSYYLQVSDTLGRTYTDPGAAPEEFYSFRVGTDTTPPIVEHDQTDFTISISKDSLLVEARIRDNLGIDSALVLYSVNDVELTPVVLYNDTLANYKGYLDFSSVILQDADIILYRIKAVDGSAAALTTFSPASGSYSITASEIPPAVNEYSNDFELAEDAADFDLSKNVYFERTQPANFSSHAMHTLHPYPSPNAENQEINMSANLKVPIILRPDDAYMSFDEIAYIEPGENGSQFGDEDFWDYVVVEGSDDFGETWHILEEPWDARREESWAQHYELGIRPSNPGLSTSVPEEEDIRNHIVNLFGPDTVFQGNDEIQIRFRLYSDPFAHGWGWMIDNIQIQGELTRIEEYAIFGESLRVFPNPSSGRVRVDLKLKHEVDELEVRVTDLVGKEMMREVIRRPDPVFLQEFDLSGLHDGIYLMQFRSGDQRLTRKLILAR